MIGLQKRKISDFHPKIIQDLSLKPNFFLKNQ